MRVLVTTQPAPSHLGPMAPYLCALQAAGHEVRIAAAASFQPTVESLGFTGIPCGLDWLETDVAATFPEIEALDGPGRLLFFLQRIFGGVAADAFVRDLPAVIDAWEPDILLWEAAEFGGHAVAESKGIPHLPVALGMRLGPVVLGMLMAEGLAARRTALGLPPDPTNQAPFRHGCASLFPPEWLPVLAPNPLPTERFFHPVPDYRPQRQRTGMPLVYVSLGTVFYGMPGVMETLLAGLRDGDWDVLAAIGRTRDPADFGPQPPNVRLEPFVPQREVLATAALAVHHGGFSSTMECLAAGVPQLVVPLSADQGMHADAVARHRVGAAAAHALGEGLFGLALIDPVKLDAATVRAEAEQVLGDPAMADRVERFRARVDQLPREDAFVSYVEELAGGSRTGAPAR
jgi:UDP:flavonoid glycosyltransferase YjiC (YdhE family)